MAWQTVKCSKCDTGYQVQMYGPHKDRDWRATNWTGTCDECKAKTVSEAVTTNADSDLVTLTGSDKQIAWAMTIRDKFVVEWSKIKPSLPPEAAGLVIEIDQVFVEQTQSKFWINNRDRTLQSLCHKLDINTKKIKRGIVMTIYTIAQKMSNSGTIHDIASDMFDREIQFPAGHKYALVLASYYGGKGYTTHKTDAAVSKASMATKYSHMIINADGNEFVTDWYGNLMSA